MEPLECVFDMDFVFKCPQCDQSLEVDSSAIGSEIVCPACNHVIVVPAPAPSLERKPTVAPPKQDRLLSLSGSTKGPELLIQKPNRPLAVAAKLDDKKFHVKTIRHADCISQGTDSFDTTVSEFMDKLAEAQVISVTPISYSRLEPGTERSLMDYGVLIVYKS